MNQDPILCTCEDIRQSQVKAAIEAGNTDFRSLRQALNIAAQCGHCHRPILKLLRQFHPRPIVMPKPSSQRHFPMPWKHFSHAKLEQEYSPSSCVDDIMVYIQSYIDDSTTNKQQLSVRQNLEYGADHTLGVDYFPGQDQQPLIVYIHGGYWQELSKNESCFMADSLIAQGYHLLVIDYTLAPQATIETMISQCCQAIAWSQQQLWSFDSESIVLTGSSAGAHLAACVLQCAAHAQYGLKPETFTQAVLFSGIYDLRPLVDTYVNEPLQLTQETAAALSPGLQGNQNLPPCTLVWGANETSEFKRQSQQYGEFLITDGVLCKTQEIPERNHFDVVYELANLLP